MSAQLLLRSRLTLEIERNVTQGSAVRREARQRNTIQVHVMAGPKEEHTLTARQRRPFRAAHILSVGIEA